MGLGCGESNLVRDSLFPDGSWALSLSGGGPGVVAAIAELVPTRPFTVLISSSCLLRRQA